MKRVFLGLWMILAASLVLGTTGCVHSTRSQHDQTFVLAVTVHGQQPTAAQWALVKAQIATKMAERGWRPVDDIAQADQIVRVEFIPDATNPEANGQIRILAIQPNPVGPLVLSGRTSAYPTYASYDPYPSSYRYYGYYSWGWDYPFGYDWSYPYAYGHTGRHHSSGSSDTKPTQPPPGNQPKPRPPVSSDDRPRPPRDRWDRRSHPDSPGGSSSGGYSSGSSSSSGSAAYSGSSSSGSYSSGSSDSGSSSSGSSGSSYSGSSDSGSSSSGSSMNTSHSYGNSRQPD